MKNLKSKKLRWKRYWKPKRNKNYRAGRNGNSRFENSKS